MANKIGVDRISNTYVHVGNDYTRSWKGGMLTWTRSIIVLPEPHQTIMGGHNESALWLYMPATPHPSYPELCCLGVRPLPLPPGGWSSAGETPPDLTHSLPCLSSRSESSRSSDDLQLVWSSEDPQIDEPVSGCHGDSHLTFVI